MPYLDLGLRWMHILCAVGLVGGTYFWRFALWPALRSVDQDLRTPLLGAIRGPWARLVMITSGLLLLSGLVNAVRIIQAYQFVEGAPYHLLVAIKLLLALAVFWVAAKLSGRSESAERFRENMGTWLTVNVVLTTLLVCLAGYMKVSERTLKLDSPTAATEETVDG